MSFTPTPEELMEMLDTMTQEQFVHDPLQHALAALSNVAVRAFQTRQARKALLLAFIQEYRRLTDEEMRDRYRYTHQLVNQERFEREADEWLRDRQERRR